jgi:uncharacterized membrane protein
MATISASVDIAAPLSKVFAFVVAEWEGTLAFWPRGIRRWTPLSAAPLGDGFRVRYRAQLLGVPFSVEMEVCDFVYERGWRARSVGGPPAEGRWEFEPNDSGTEFTYRLSYEMPPPGVGPLLDRWLLGPAWERAIGEALANLKRQIEAQASDDVDRSAV